MKKLFFVLVLSGPLKGHKYYVKTDSEILIGRSEDAIIRIGYDDFCSRKHASLYWENNKCFVEDLNSTNGTFINGIRINREIELHSGDIIGLGDTKISVGMKDCSDENVPPAEDDMSHDDKNHKDN